MSTKKIIKPSLSTHKKLIGDLFYIYIKQIVTTISEECNLVSKLQETLLDHILTNSYKIFNYKIYNNVHNNLLSDND